MAALNASQISESLARLLNAGACHAHADSSHDQGGATPQGHGWRRSPRLVGALQLRMYPSFRQARTVNCAARDVLTLNVGRRPFQHLPPAAAGDAQPGGVGAARPLVRSHHLLQHHKTRLSTQPA